MELYDRELAQAAERLTAAGRNQDDFTFAMAYLPPDPDGGGMYTVRYEVTVTRKSTGKSLKTFGGIGLRWVDYFDEALGDGHFD